MVVGHRLVVMVVLNPDRLPCSRGQNVMTVEKPPRRPCLGSAHRRSQYPPRQLTQLGSAEWGWSSCQFPSRTPTVGPLSKIHGTGVHSLISNEGHDCGRRPNILSAVGLSAASAALATLGITPLLFKLLGVHLLPSNISSKGVEIRHPTEEKRLHTSPHLSLPGSTTDLYR